jgi:hypothetical protein
MQPCHDASVKINLASLAVLLAAVAALGCSSSTPSPHTSPLGGSPSLEPTTTNSLGPPLASIPSPSVAVSSSLDVAAQDAIFRAVGEWVRENHEVRLTQETYVLSNLEDPQYWATAMDREPELAGAGLPLWGDEMSGASFEALIGAMEGAAELERVDDAQTVVDPEGFEVLGCRPYFGGWTMLRLGPPVPVRKKFAVYVKVDRGCRGEVAMLFVEPSSSQFEVTSVIFEGDWAV